MSKKNSEAYKRITSYFSFEFYVIKLLKLSERLALRFIPKVSLIEVIAHNNVKFRIEKRHEEPWESTKKLLFFGRAFVELLQIAQKLYCKRIEEHSFITALENFFLTLIRFVEPGEQFTFTIPNTDQGHFPFFFAQCHLWEDFARNINWSHSVFTKFVIWALDCHQVVL